MGQQQYRMLTALTWLHLIVRSLRNWKNCQYNVKLTYITMKQVAPNTIKHETDMQTTILRQQ